jgi:hypothetical protein
MLAAGCGGEPRSPVGLFEPGERPSGRSSSASPVVGAWQVTLLVSVQADLQEWTTRWQFDADRRCAFRRTTFSAVEGVRRTVERECTWVDRGGVLEVRYSDTGHTDRLPYSVPAFDTRRLVLEGVEYQRVG